MFAKRMLTQIFGPKREGVGGGWKTLNNEELHNLYSRNIIVIANRSRMRFPGRVDCMGRKRNAGKPEGQRPLERRKLMWGYNIKTDIKQAKGVCTGFICLKNGVGSRLVWTLK